MALHKERLTGKAVHIPEGTDCDSLQEISWLKLVISLCGASHKRASIQCQPETLPRCLGTYIANLRKAHNTLKATESYHFL